MTAVCSYLGLESTIGSSKKASSAGIKFIVKLWWIDKAKTPNRFHMTLHYLTIYSEVGN
jgi:hypothetical protein